MITNMSLLDWKCKKCNKRADFAVTRTNDDTPKRYYKKGVREECFCRKHVPKDAKEYWNSELFDLPKQKI